MESKLLLNEQLVIYLIFPDLINYLSNFSHAKHDFTSQHLSKRTQSITKKSMIIILPFQFNYKHNSWAYESTLEVQQHVNITFGIMQSVVSLTRMQLVMARNGESYIQAFHHQLNQSLIYDLIQLLNKIILDSMLDFHKYLSLFLSTIMAVVSYVPVLIYSYIFSEFFTKATYRLIGERNKGRLDVKNVLDIGTATGHPLHSIIDSFGGARVIGIDYNPLYVPACRKLFQPYTNVEIRQMNYYDLEANYPQTLFDVIIFGSSFMIMPDQTKALEIAQRCLAKNGRIYFLLTLYEQKNRFNKFMEYVKPLLKFLSTIDFGRVTYREDFQAFLLGHNLRLTLNQRCSGNTFLKMFKFYIYEAEKI